MKVLQVVRDFGPVGGMERYVWELCQHLPELGVDTEILCDINHSKALPSITVHELGGRRFKPRWLSALDFSRRAAQWWSRYPHPIQLVHSHDAIGFHHITTFHAPPFASIRHQAIWKQLSPRVLANLWIEKRQLFAPSVQAVVPNSELIASRLLSLYPGLKPRLVNPIIPGVDPVPERTPKTQTKPKRIGFVGKEWRRKGLDIAVGIVREMLKVVRDIEFVVIGPHPNEVIGLFDGFEGQYQLMGAVDARDHYQHFDLLLHPARMEPFGMVITEALSAGVPVIASDQCGAAAILDAEYVLSVQAAPGIWAHRCLQAIGRPIPKFRRSWKDMAQEYVELYRRLAHAG